MKMLGACWRATASAARLFHDLLRELGDEGPYRRHLAAHGMEHSGPEWRRFQNQHLRAKYLRAKCC